MTAELGRCTKRVSGHERWAKLHQCQRNAKVVVEGKSFCTQHSPAAQEKRDKAYREKRDTELENRHYSFAAAAWCRAKGMTIEELIGEAAP